MFTGIIEGVGTVALAARRGGTLRLGVASRLPLREIRDGDSICVDGVCLTVVSRARDRFHADVIPETLSRTTLGDLRPGDRVNLERALRAGDRLGGHMVQGHVDAVAPVLGVLRSGADYRLRVALPQGIRRFVAEKGSIALHGVSLTVSGLSEDAFEVALIPATRSGTTLGRIRAGDRLHVEVDVLARYLERLAESSAGKARTRPARAALRKESR